MRNKKLLILFPFLAGLTLSSCSFKDTIKGLFGKKEEQKQDSKKDVYTGYIDDDYIPDGKIHAVSISSTPTASFYLKVNEERNVSVSLSPSPTDPSEKTFTWTNTTIQNVEVKVNEQDTTKATLKGLKPGNALVKATNEYNPSLYKFFNATVIDFDEENAYLWEYDSSDRKQFGYDSENKVGNASGEAILNGMKWNFTRSKTTSLQTSNGAIGFGKGEAPETHVHLETENDRKITRIQIEASSAESLGKMTLKIGDTIVYDNVTLPKVSSEKNLGLFNANNLENLTGKISIDVETPEYEIDKSEDPNYKKPGAFYLKSILINYASDTIVDAEISPNSTHKVDFLVGEEFSYDGLIIQKETSTGRKYDVSASSEIEKGNLTIVAPDMSTASHEAKNVTVTYSQEGLSSPINLSYPIHVRDQSWIPEYIEINGEVDSQTLEAGDSVDYSSLFIKEVYDESLNDFVLNKFESNAKFSIKYGDNKNPFFADSDMNEGFEITVKAKYGDATKEAKYSVTKGTLIVTAGLFDRIDFTSDYAQNNLKLTTSNKLLGLTSENGSIYVEFSAVKKDSDFKDENDNFYPLTSKEFSISVLNTNYSVKSVDIEFKKKSNSINDFSLKASAFGGDIYGNTLATLENDHITFDNFDDCTNYLLVSPGINGSGSQSTTLMGVVSIVIKFKEQAHVSFDLEAISSTPLKTQYNEGDKFDPAGLQINLVSDYKSTNVDITNLIVWYDGSNYEQSPQEILIKGTTSVIGVFHNKTVQIAINAVSERNIKLALVKSASEIVDGGKYYLVNRTNKVMFKGASGNTFYTLSEDVGELLNIKPTEENFCCTFKAIDGGFHIITNDSKAIGMTNSGNISFANEGSSSPATQTLSLEFNETTCIATFKLTALISENQLSKVLYFGSNNKLALGADTVASNISLYKVVN